MKDEGEDPESYVFELAARRATPVKKTPVKAKSEDDKAGDDDASGEVVVDEVGTVDGEVSDFVDQSFQLCKFFNGRGMYELIGSG